MSKHKELAVDYFDRHRACDECFITSDNRVFHTKGSADSFASVLEDKKISILTRESVKSRDENRDQAERALKIKELEETELVNENYKAVKNLVKYFQIEVADQKAETLIVALTDYKLKLQA